MITARFSMRTLAGMVRAEVAVGIDSDSSMFLAVRAAAPFKRTLASWQVSPSGELTCWCALRWA